MSGNSKIRSMILYFLLVLNMLSFVSAGQAMAGVGGSDVPTVPGHVDLGETGVPFSFTIKNLSTNPNDVNNVQALDGFIFFTTTCGFSGSPALACPVGAQEAPNTIEISPLTATGQAGTACAGITFTVSQTANPNEYLFTPSAPMILGPSSTGGLAATCKVNFTVKVNSLPTHDSSGSAGLQTSQLARIGSASGDGGLQDTTTLETGSAAGSSTVNVFNHCLHVVKTCTSATSCIGNIGVSVAATNCGPEGLTNLVVTDNQAGALACNSTTLAPGASTTCSGSYTNVPGTYTDTITASAVSANSQQITTPDATSILSATCSTPPAPTISISKTCRNATSCSATGIDFLITVTNGPVAGSAVLTDSSCGINETVALAANQVITRTCAISGSGTVTNTSGASVTITANSCSASASTGAVSCSIPECGKVCPNASPLLGAIATGPNFCTILNNGGSVAITGPAGEIQGNICIGDSGTLSMSGGNFVTNPGKVLLEAGASCSGCSATRVPGGVEQPFDLTTEILSCQEARAAHTPPYFGGTGPDCTEIITTLQNIAINGVISRTGVNIICITNQQEVQKNIRLTGDATTKYIFVVQGKFKYNGAKVVTDCTPPQADPVGCTAAGVGPDDVVWLFVGPGQELRSSGGGGGTSCCKAVLDGNVIINGTVALAPGLLNGQICGTGNWSFVSGSGVHCPDP